MSEWAHAAAHIDTYTRSRPECSGVNWTRSTGNRRAASLTFPGVKADMGRRYRLYPNRAQEQVLTRWRHAARTLWNIALEQRTYVFEQRGSTLRSQEQSRYLTAARGESELAWLAELPAQAAQQVLRHLDQAYDNFFNPALPSRFPAFKKRGTRLSVPLPGQAVKVRKTSGHWGQIRLPKLGWVSFRLSRTLGGTIRNATVSRDGTGWHIAFGVHTGRTPGAPNSKPGCGSAPSRRGRTSPGVRPRRRSAHRRAVQQSGAGRQCRGLQP